MSTYFNHHQQHFHSKHRSDSAFQSPSPVPTPSIASARNPNPFDPNLYVPSPSGTPTTFSESYRKDHGGSIDFSDELAAFMKSGSGPNANGISAHSNSTTTAPATSSSYDDYSRHPPHNIFDVSAHPTGPPPGSAGGLGTGGGHHGGHFGSHFSIPIPNSQFRPGSSHHHHGPDSPFTSTSPFSPHSEGGFNHHLPLPSPLPPLNINGHHPPGPADDLHSSSPFVHHPPPLSGMEHHHRPPSPLTDSRSRSRSKPPMSAGGLGTNTTRTRMTKKRASMSGIDRPHPSAIMIPGNGSRPNTSSSSAPLSAHNMGWPAFSLPTPDSLSQHAFSNFGGTSPKSVLSHGKKEESPELDPVSKQAAIAHEKRRRRRESHNAVERRRRDNINEKISELATLIPECLLDPAITTPGANGNQEMGIEVFTSGAQGADDLDSKDMPAIKANKGMILRKSVDYIRYLQQLVTAQASRNRDLEAQLQHIHSRGGVGSSPSISSPQSSDSAPDINNQNFHVFGDELLNGLNGMGMVDILHGLGHDDEDAYINMQFPNGTAKSPTSSTRFDGLETLHEHANGGAEHRYNDGLVDDNGHDGDGEMELDDTSPSASADSPEERESRGPEVEKEEAERGRARMRTRKMDEVEAPLTIKKESAMEV